MLMAYLMAYLMAGDALTQDEVGATSKTFNEARGHKIESDDVEELPESVGAAA